MSKTFVEVEQHRVFTMCDQVKVPREWVSWKFDLGYDEWLEKTSPHHPSLIKFMTSDYDPTTQRIKGESLVHPDIYASLV